MTIYCANGFFPVRYIGSSVCWLPDDCQDVVIPDLWYARRKGPTDAEYQHARLFHHSYDELPKQGRYTALCHAKFRQEYAVFQGNLPTNAANVERLYQRDASGAMVEVASLIPDTSGQARGILYYYQYSGEHHLTVWYVSCEGRVIDGIPKIYVSANGYAYESKTYRPRRGDYNVRMRFYGDHSKWEQCDVDRWTADSFLDLVRRTLSSAPDPGQWRITSGTYYRSDAPVSKQYVETQARQALDSALRYQDRELVDYSIDPVSRPWAFSEINFLTGRADAYADSLDDILTECDNNLQNIVMIVSMLEMLAFASSNVFAKWADYRGLSKSIKTTIRQKNWYRTNARGLTRREQLVRQFRADKAFIESEFSMPAAIAEFMRTKHEAFGEASSAWLQGRYVFSTSVMDMGQAWDYWYQQAQRWIGERSADNKCHGSSAQEKGIFQCTCVLRERALHGVTKCFETAWRHGLEPNAYVLWDFVPFSFVVDWFYPIGDAFRDYTRACHLTPELWEYMPTYDGNALCYSVAYTSQSPMLGSIDVYTRWYEASPPEVDPAILLQADSHRVRNVLTAENFKNEAYRRSTELDRNARRTIDVIALL